MSELTLSDVVPHVPIKKPKKVKPRKLRIPYKIVVAILILITSVGSIVHYVNNHEIHPQTPVVVNVRFQTPLAIYPRIKVPKVVEVIKEVKASEPDPLNSNERYLCNKFGSNCRTALAIHKAESNSDNCESFHINENNTIDFGYMQINTVHLKKGWKISELINCEKNIDYAYQIFVDWGGLKDPNKGFSAWSTYTNGKYKQHL